MFGNKIKLKMKKLTDRILIGTSIIIGVAYTIVNTWSIIKSFNL